MKSTTPKRGGSPWTRTRRLELVLALCAIPLIIAVWLAGGARSDAELLPSVRQAMPTAKVFVKQNGTLYAAYGDSARTALLGYVAIGTADGYGGPLTLAVAVDAEGRITGLVEVSDKETPAWNERVMRSDLPSSLVGKTAAEQFRLGSDVDGVSGATYTSRALAQAALDGSRQCAAVLGLPYHDSPSPRIVFGVPEVAVLALFAFAAISRFRRFKHKKAGRWVSLLVGLAVLGFLYNLPLTVAFFSKMLLGYWPQWQTNLYWYLLLGGTVLFIVLDNKNVYCGRVCPFGAAQECMGAIGGTRIRTPSRYRSWLRWLPRALALTAIVLGLYFRSPGVASYELFGTLFGFRGSGVEFLALGLVLLGALFMRRPWCQYLCPVGPILDWMRIVRGGVLESWRRMFTRGVAT